MINPEQRQLVHKFLLLELAVKSLQIDYLKVEQFKLSNVFLPLMDSLLKDLRNKCFNLKRQLTQQRIRIVGWTKIDEYFSDVKIATAGNDVELRYANQALKTNVENLLNDHINKKMKL
ncbi:aconitate hydratase [Lysinibacillus sp. NPDC093712]|uniref:aconitate hydratase n=1 Tax=Lysinibacillus sp. NPDC093712 TaxID=3390579 RepID=UPI003D0875D0